MAFEAKLRGCKQATLPLQYNHKQKDQHQKKVNKMERKHNQGEEPAM